MLSYYEEATNDHGVVMAEAPDTPAGRAEMRRLLGVKRLAWHDYDDGTGVSQRATQPGHAQDECPSRAVFR